MCRDQHSRLSQPAEIVIVGTGFAGIGMAIRLKRVGIEDFVLLEKESELGGTWRDNTYPGCACDVPSYLYSFSFAPYPHWSRMFAPAGEIWDYLRHCVDRYDLAPHIRYRADIATMNALIGYLTDHCCRGRGRLVDAAACAPACTPDACAPTLRKKTR